MHAQSLGHVRFFVTPRTGPRQASLSVGFPRQEYWSGLPFRSPGILLTQGSNPHLLYLLHYQADSLPQHDLGSLPILTQFKVA